MNDILLDVKGLSVEIPTDDGLARPVQKVSFKIERGKTLGVVGESGCGKSITGLSLLQLIPRPGEISAGEIYWYDKDAESPVAIHLLHRDADEMRDIRGNKIAMIFQEPMSSLNPVYSIGEQIGEVVRLHQNKGKKEARGIAIQMLDKVGIPGAAKRVDDYPHQFSGGMRQRAMIAMALSCNPQLLIADEPTTALDVTIQAQILDLLKSLQDDMNMAVMMITHDLGVIADMADDMIIMYAGRVVESGRPDHIFYRSRHPYTKGLLNSIPRMGSSRNQPLASIPGIVPSPIDPPLGCAFFNRCSDHDEICNEDPEWTVLENCHGVKCWHHAEVAENES